ncbi:hypothetical protein [Marinobacter sp. OP 3.4]|uniref:hypothetical protein n=1 Tax=Marinobacter sp. OP 3.4 TaxID=3076501 RepID=UPI002E2361EC
MNDDQYGNYLHDLGVLIKEKALDAKVSKERSIGQESAGYDLGYLMAFYEVVSLMKQQADAFGIDPDQMGLGDIDPDIDLL